MGRATHIDVKIFINDAIIKTTQVAFPEHVTSSVYRSGIYAAHGQSTTSNASDTCSPTERAQKWPCPLATRRR
jgi:hypothetical protein